VTDASIAVVVEACRTASGHRTPVGLRPVAERIADVDGWERVVAAGPAYEWEAPYAHRAADVVARWARWTAGDALVHRDIRADNTTVDAVIGAATLPDWAYAAAGAPWLDLAQLAADASAIGRPSRPRRGAMSLALTPTNDPRAKILRFELMVRNRTFVGSMGLEPLSGRARYAVVAEDPVAVPVTHHPAG
jgi:hypothetical protein